MPAALLLSRYAEGLFWLARYMERAENLARILDVTETFAQDGGKSWLSVVQINADEERFFLKHDKVTGPAVAQFYLLDADNPTSILSAVQAARENARTLRPLIATEMWAQLNVFYHRLRELTPSHISGSKISKLCSEIKEACQTHTGITEGTFFRDQGWYFYGLGKYLERADQTTRLLDIKYHLLLPKPGDVGSPLDVAQWNALLRAADGYYVFRRIQTGQMTPAEVAGLLLFSEAFPRSVTLCVRQADYFLTQMCARYGLKRGDDALACLGGLRGRLAQQPTGDIISTGLHEYLDWVQQQLGSVSASIAQAFFTHESP